MKYKVMSLNSAKILLFSFILYILLSFLHTQAAVAAGVSLSVYPPIIQIQALPPATVKSDITIENTANESVNLIIGVKPFTASDSLDGQVKYYPPFYIPTPDKHIFEKMQIVDGDNPIDSIELAPKQKKILTLIISIPKNEQFADYYFSLVFLSKPDTNSSNPSSYAAGGIASNVLLSIGPQTAPKADVQEFSSPWYVDHGPVPFTVLVSNNGAHLITPSGLILVTNMFGQTIGKITLPPTNILGQKSRYLSDSDSTNDNHPVSLWNDIFLLGPYTVQLKLSLADTSPTIVKTIHFFAFPWQGILILLLSIGMISTMVVLIRKRLAKMNGA